VLKADLPLILNNVFKFDKTVEGLMHSVIHMSWLGR